MKFRVEHDAFAEAVAWVARALPSRPVVPVLSGLRLAASDGLLALSCFDYELAATVRVTAEVFEPGTELVPGRLLAEITRSLPGQPAEFGSQAGEVVLSCGSAEFTLVPLPLADYPAIPEPPPLAGTIEGEAMAAAIAQVLPAASRDDTLPILTAVCLDIDGDQITLAATDRYRLAVRRLRWEPAEPGLRAVALVPARTLADAARIMTAGAPVSVAFAAGESTRGEGTAGESTRGEGTAGGGPGGGSGSGRRAGEPRPAEGMIAFECGGRRLTGRLIGGEFIRYESRFPASFGCRAELAAASFTEAVRRVSLVADRASPVRLTFSAGKAVIEAQTEGRAKAVETVTASFHGDEPSIAFNPQYLLDGLTAAASAAVTASGEARAGEARAGEAEGGAGQATVRLEFTSPAKPALITPAGEGGTAVGERAAAGPGAEPSFRYLVVPLRSPTRA